MSLLSEFRTFAIKGNAVDLAIGVIIGAAFGKIVSSLVGDVIMPPIGALLGGVDFSALELTVKQATATSPAVVVRYGAFLNTVIDFAIIAFVIFVIVKVMNSLSRQEEAKAPTTRECPQCLMSIPFAAKKCGHCCSDVSRP